MSYRSGVLTGAVAALLLAGAAAAGRWLFVREPAPGLEDEPSVERLDLPSGEHAYVACEPSHHDHLVCSACGRSQDIDDGGLRPIVRDIARRTGYRVDAHRLELFGLCPDCQTRATH